MKYYKFKEILYLTVLTLLGAIVWVVIGQPQSIQDIYMGIGFEARPLYYMQFIGEYVVYAWSCMGFMEPYLKRGGIYRIIRERKKEKFLWKIHQQLILHLLCLMFLQILLYSICLFIAGSIEKIYLKKLLMDGFIRFIVFYWLCLMQILLEIWIGQKAAFGAIWIFNLLCLGLADGTSLINVVAFPTNLAMTLRRDFLPVENVIVFGEMVMLIAFCIWLGHLTVKKRDFLNV